jgi:hypothetical protein
MTSWGDVEINKSSPKWKRGGSNLADVLTTMTRYYLDYCGEDGDFCAQLQIVPR